MSRGERWVPDARLVKRREPCFSLLVPELELRRGGGGGGGFSGTRVGISGRTLLSY